MKTLPIVVLLFIVASAFSQSGKITMNNTTADPGEQTTFTYEPPAGLYLPEDIQVNVSCSDFQIKTIPLEKKGSSYEFALKLPLKSTVLFFTVTDNQQHTVDNNGGKGYVACLKDPTEEGYEQTLLEKIRFSGMATYSLKLEYSPQDRLDAYESVFASYPYLKNETTYVSYLMLLFQVNKEEARPELLDFAKKMVMREEEESLTAAYQIYRRLEMNAELKELEKVAVEKYPEGTIARIIFLADYYDFGERDEIYIAAKINEYFRLFGTPEEHELDMLYFELFSLYLDRKDTLSLEKYKDQVSDPGFWVNFYNNYAWRASGGDMTSPGKDLDFAAEISKKSLDLLDYLKEHPEANTTGADVEGMHHMCADTYALILYKLKKYDLAFRYQHEILEAVGGRMQTDLKERYAAFAEKAKGPEFAREYLEKQLLAGTDSKIMVEQLQKIYTDLNLPEDEFEQLKKQYKESAAQKDREEIIERFGEIKALDFTLTNREDENVTLSDFEGKVVLLDFWSTWCGPCISSFPKMQEMVSQFENDPVEFFFVNSWENQEPDKVKEKVEEFLEEKGYNFNVLFDYNDEVINAYKVRGIPARILIDKSGNIKAIVRYSDDLAVMIHESLN